MEFHPWPEGGERPCPVDYKRGKRNRWENDDVWLLQAQGLCLEEMLSVDVPRGAIFHAASKRRREVEFSRELRETTVERRSGLPARVGAAGAHSRSCPDAEVRRLLAEKHLPARTLSAQRRGFVGGPRLVPGGSGLR